jgi:hypothetical protein
MTKTASNVPSMTFAEFRRTRMWSEDIGAALNDGRWDYEPQAGKGFLYDGDCYIEQTAVNWPDMPAGQWSLLIWRDEWISDDLAALERRLYDWCVGEGFFE